MTYSLWCKGDRQLITDKYPFHNATNKAEFLFFVRHFILLITTVINDSEYIFHISRSTTT